ncbi:MAG: tetratricopeptide repeat protein [Kiritimatiellae bacterium]|nr:tetratricopeptide repeat protein [Kiritimatiellia bacterium]
MSTENSPNTSAEKPASHNPLKDRRLEVSEVPEVLGFLRENGVSILVGAGIAAAVFLGWSVYRNQQISGREQASAQIFSAQTAEQVQQVVNEFPKTPAASLGQIMLAGQAFDQGQYEVAHNLFAQFIEQHPQHELRDNAAFAIIQCTEASGQYEEALSDYEEFIAEHPDHYLASSALFGKARCLELLNRFEDAKTVYQSVVSEREETDPWRVRAESALSILERDMRAVARGEKIQLIPQKAAAFSFPALQQTAPIAAPVIAPDAPAPTAPEEAAP